MSAQKIMPNGDEVIGTRKLNPETKLSLECTKESGVTNEELLKEPTFAIVAEKFYSFISDSDLYGFNIKNEIHFLIEEFRRAGILFNGIKKNIFDLTKESDIYFGQLFSFKDKIKVVELEIQSLQNLTKYIQDTEINEENLKTLCSQLLN
jgi:DNA polymerase III epsilon subunit-like protein